MGVSLPGWSRWTGGPLKNVTMEHIIFLHNGDLQMCKPAVPLTLCRPSKPGTARQRGARCVAERLSTAAAVGAFGR